MLNKSGGEVLWKAKEGTQTLGGEGVTRLVPQKGSTMRCYQLISLLIYKRILTKFLSTYLLVFVKELHTVCAM